MAEFAQQLQDVFLNLFNSGRLMEILGQPEMTIAAFVALNLIIFTETGLLIGFFLPGDSLLVTVGIVAYHAGWNLPLLLVTLTASAIVGDSVGYSIGASAGPKIFHRDDSWFFRKDHLLAARSFYERHGGKTIVIARFVPIIRTFAPVVAGAGKMNYRRFLFFNVTGGIAWIFSMVLLGYALTPLLQPMLTPLFGDGFQIQHHVEKVIVLVVLLSIAPGLVAWLRARGAAKLAAATAATE